MTVEYLLSDHLNSTSLTTDANGAKVSEMRYKPWGELRYTWTSAPATTPAYKMPLYTYTGQASYMDDPSTSATEGFGLMFYQSRFYDPQLSRFTQADTIIPESTQGTQAWDRYAGMNNNPIRYNDPSGHCPFCVTGAIGALAGAAIGGITYAMTNSGDSFNGKELAVAMGVGAVAGALVGSGLGIVSAAATTASTALAAGAGLATVNTIMTTAVATAGPYVSAGIAAGVTAESYMFQNPGEFESTPFVTSAGIAGTTAAVSYGNLWWEKALIEGAGAAISYSATTAPEDFSLTNAGIAFGGGAVGGTIDAGLSGLAGDFLTPNITSLNKMQWMRYSAMQGAFTGTSTSTAIWYAQRHGETE
jgi:RHS repeat-associated protein